MTIRKEWLDKMHQVVYPVLSNLSCGTLKQNMPLCAVKGHEKRRAKSSHFEAFARTFAGIAPWLDLDGLRGDELRMQKDYKRKVFESLRTLFPYSGEEELPSSQIFESNDSLLFDDDCRQFLVEAAFMCLGFLRAPKCFKSGIFFNDFTKTEIINFLRDTRQLMPSNNNWLLFSAMVEVCLKKFGMPYDELRIDYALRRFDEWHLGDGIYGDGPLFQNDYYNSFVIHPSLNMIYSEVWDTKPKWDDLGASHTARSIRYAQIQQRSIAFDGEYPLIGRSLSYRCGAFHALADCALRLDEISNPSQIRNALDQVIHITLCDSSFDIDGWLRVGLVGHQPSIAEDYISTGSLYMCMNAFLPLGLPASSDFWKNKDVPLTQTIAWTGKDIPCEEAMDRLIEY